MKITRENSIRLNRVAWYHRGSNSPTEKQISRYVGKDLNSVLSQIRNSSQFKKQAEAVKNYDPKREKELQNALEGAEQIADVYKRDYESAIKEIKQLQKAKTQLVKQNKELEKHQSDKTLNQLGEVLMVIVNKIGVKE